MHKKTPNCWIMHTPTSLMCFSSFSLILEEANIENAVSVYLLYIYNSTLTVYYVYIVFLHEYLFVFHNIYVTYKPDVDIITSKVL